MGHYTLRASRQQGPTDERQFDLQDAQFLELRVACDWPEKKHQYVVGCEACTRVDGVRVKWLRSNV
jgi:hypothetical protein